MFIAITGDLRGHASDVTNAVNFMHVDGEFVQTGNTAYFDKEPTMTDVETILNNPGVIVDHIETKEIEMTEEQTEKATDEMKKRYKKKRYKKKPLTEEQKADRRFWNFLDVVYKLAQMSGLYIEGHIKVRDKRTGKVWE